MGNVRKRKRKPYRVRIRRPIIIDGDIARIPLTKGYEAIIDAADVHLIADRNWRAAEGKSGHTYAAYNTTVSGKCVCVLMHRVIAGAGPDLVVDHKSGDGLDNRRSNLRQTDHCGNMANTRFLNNKNGLKGICLEKKKSCPNKPWKAELESRGRRITIGRFATKEEAAAAYDKAAVHYHGEFARTNKMLGLLK